MIRSDHVRVGSDFQRLRQPDRNGSQTSQSRLDWVGRNHGAKKLEGGKDRRRTNFLYADGHVETKTIEETLKPFQWGKRFYSYPDLRTDQQ